MRDIARFFVRYQIDPENLLYLTREEQRTVLHLLDLSLIHISEPTRQAEISYAVFCLKKKKKKTQLRVQEKVSYLKSRPLLKKQKLKEPTESI